MISFLEVFLPKCLFVLHVPSSLFLWFYQSDSRPVRWTPALDYKALYYTVFFIHYLVCLWTKYSTQRLVLTHQYAGACETLQFSALCTRCRIILVSQSDVMVKISTFSGIGLVVSIRRPLFDSRREQKDFPLEARTDVLWSPHHLQSSRYWRSFPHCV